MLLSLLEEPWKLLFRARTLKLLPTTGYRERSRSQHLRVCLVITHEGSRLPGWCSRAADGLLGCLFGLRESFRWRIVSLKLRQACSMLTAFQAYPSSELFELFRCLPGTSLFHLTHALQPSCIATERSHVLLRVSVLLSKIF